MSREKKYEIDMCNGSIMDKLISFALPLMLSGMLQLMFNAVDIVVVGRFSGSQSLAAVGATTALIYLFTNLFIGISLGANVLAARYYAAGKHEEMSETVHTAMMFALISGIIMIFVGLFFSRLALEIMGTPSDVIDQATLYMRIYFLGMPFFMLYNYGAAILRAVGDTKRPLYFLILAGTVNALLNMFLVIVFGLGVAGVAIATVVSQMISCVLVLGCLRRTDACYKLYPSKLSMKKEYLIQIFQVGVPAGIQSTVINFSNALLQSSVNSFGSIAMAGYTAANNVLGFLFVSVNSVTQACMSFTSQNYGAGKTKRKKRRRAPALPDQGKKAEARRNGRSLSAGPKPRDRQPDPRAEPVHTRAVRSAGTTGKSAEEPRAEKAKFSSDFCHNSPTAAKGQRRCRRSGSAIGRPAGSPRTGCPAAAAR